VAILLVGRTTPQVERPRKHRVRLIRLARLQESLAFGRELLELDRIDLMAVALQRVSARTEDDHVAVRPRGSPGLQFATEPGHVRREGLLGCARRAVAP